MISVCVDTQGRVTGVCPDNLSGGVGWIWIECCLTPRTDLTNGDGVALYKVEDGVVALRRPEEIAADTQQSTVDEPTEAERLDQIEAAMIELASIIAGGQ